MVLTDTVLGLILHFTAFFNEPWVGLRSDFRLSFTVRTSNFGKLESYFKGDVSRENLSSEFTNRSATNYAVSPKKMARGLKIGI